MDTQSNYTKFGILRYLARLDKTREIQRQAEQGQMVKGLMQ